jgi:hypothetical protein
MAKKPIAPKPASMHTGKPMMAVPDLPMRGGSAKKPNGTGKRGNKR